MDEESEDIIVSPSSPLPRKASRRLQKPQICILSLALFQVKCGDSSQDVSRKWNGCWDSSGRLALYCPRVGGGIRKRSIGEDGQPCCQLNHQVVRIIPLPVTNWASDKEKFIPNYSVEIIIFFILWSVEIIIFFILWSQHPYYDFNIHIMISTSPYYDLNIKFLQIMISTANFSKLWSQQCVCLYKYNFLQDKDKGILFLTSAFARISFVFCVDRSL